jgi:SAM-dependent methyltransferase/ribosomal protein S27AE
MSQQDPASQDSRAKQAEIAFRPFLGQAPLKDPRFGEMFRQRAYRAMIDFNTLEKQGVAFNPFLEIGAGGVQRSAALMNHFRADGIATDISQGALGNAPAVLSLLGYKNSPTRICCDAHILPFLPDTFRFVFAYRTLHHLGDPAPAVAECHRVLGRGGHLFFTEEPLIGPLVRFLRGRRTLSNPPTRLQRWAGRYRLEKVFWDDGAVERAAGIIEARYTLDQWRRALAPFRVVEVEISRRLKLRSNLEKPRLKVLLSRIVGGNIKALCLKTGGRPVTGDFRERLMCLDCGASEFSEEGDKALHCGACGRVYPVEEGIIRMLPAKLEGELYG